MLGLRALPGVRPAPRTRAETYPRATPPGPGLGRDGGMAGYVRVPARHLVALGDLDPVAAAPLTDAALTPYHAISLARDRLTPDATVVAIGIGGLGHMGVQLLRATTGATIVAVDAEESRLEHAAQLGADRGVLAGAGAAEEIVALTGGRGADVVLDFVGADATLALAAAPTIGSRGRIVAVRASQAARCPSPRRASPVGLPWGASIVRPYAGTRRDLQEVVALRRPRAHRRARHPVPAGGGARRARAARARADPRPCGARRPDPAHRAVHPPSTTSS